MEAALIGIGLISLLAATVNGALGYGYSSITVPVALLWVAGRILNPALVLVEVAINVYTVILNRRAVSAVLPRIWTLLIGLVPGVAIGASLLATIDPTAMKAIVLAALLPLVLIQASGVRWQMRRERAIGLPFGTGVGLLYSITTISGPPLALLFNNQGFAKSEFKVALAVTRTAESVLTLGAYLALGLFTRESLSLVPWIVPGILIGIPLGHALIHRVEAETFRRVCMSFDAYLVSFGLARVLTQLGAVSAPWAYQLITLTGLIDARLLWTFFAGRRGRSPAPVEVVIPGAAGAAGAVVVTGAVEPAGHPHSLIQPPGRDVLSTPLPQGTP